MNQSVKVITRPRLGVSLDTAFVLTVLTLALGIALGVFVFPASRPVQQIPLLSEPLPFRPGKLMIILRDTVSVQEKREGANPTGAIDAGPYFISAPTLKQLNEQRGVRSIAPILSPKSTKFAELKDRIFLLSFDEKTSPLDHNEMVKAYRADPNVAIAELDFIARTTLVPDDPYYESQGSWGQPERDLWGLYKVGLTPTIGTEPPGSGESGWDIERGNPATTIAISDTGVDYNHQDIAANIWMNEDEIRGNGIDDDDNGYVDDWNGFDFVNGTFNPDTGVWTNDANGSMDDHFHGTHVAGTSAAVTNNATGIAGVCWSCTIMPVKGLNYRGSGYFDWLIKTIEYAAENGAAVVNMSWGGSGVSQILEAVLAAAHGNGVTLVAAAGNDSSDALSQTPANSPSVITVSSLAPDDTRSSFSNFGTKIDVAAPGGGHRSTANDLWRNILSLKWSGAAPDPLDVGVAYRRLAGTSMAAPHVSGIVGLLKAHRPSLDPETVRAVLRQSAHDVNAATFPGWDEEIGHGLANTRDALLIDEPLVSRLTTPGILEPVSPGSVFTFVGSTGGPGFTGYEIAVSPASGAPAWETVASGTEPRTNEPLGQWNVPAQALGGYVVRLAVHGGSATLEDARLVMVGQHAGWPLRLDYPHTPAVGDLDEAVPGLEIAYSTSEFIEEGGHSGFRFFGVHHDATPIEGWSNQFYNVPLFDKPTIADIDPARPGLEIAGVNGLGTLYLLNNRGQNIAVENIIVGGGCIVSSNTATAVADFDAASPGLEVAAGAGCEYAQSHVNVYSSQLQPLRSFTAPEHFRSKPTMADIDGNGTMELFMGSMDRKIYAWKQDGSLMSGWPQTVLSWPYAGVTVANLDNAGQPEAVILDNNAIVNVKRANGTNVYGWPQDLPGYNYAESVTVADVDYESPGLEIVTTGGSLHTLYVLRKNGTTVPGFPVSFQMADRPIDSTPLVVQLDPATPEPELLVASGSTVYAISSEGVILPELTLRHPDIVTDPIIDDFDADGLFELLVRGDTGLYLWDLPVAAQPVPWPEPHFNRTNNPLLERCEQNVPSGMCLPDPPEYCTGSGIVVESCGAPGNCGCPVATAECRPTGDCGCVGGIEEGQCAPEQPYLCTNYAIVPGCAGPDRVADTLDDCGCPEPNQFCDASQSCAVAGTNDGLNGTYFCGENFDYAYASNVRDIRINWPFGLDSHWRDLGRETNQYCQEHQLWSNSVRWQGVVLVDNGGPVTFYASGSGFVKLFVDDLITPIINWQWGQGNREATQTLTAGWHPMKLEFSTPMMFGASLQLGWQPGGGGTYNEVFPNGQIDVTHIIPPDHLRPEPVTLFSDTFDDGDDTGWQKVGDWTVQSDGESSPYYRMGTPSTFAQYAWVSGQTFEGDHQVTARVKRTTGTGFVGLDGAYASDEATYRFLYAPNSNALFLYRGNFLLHMERPSRTLDLTQWHQLQLLVLETGNNTRTLVGRIWPESGNENNGVEIRATDDNPLPNGTIGLRCYGNNTTCRFDDVRVATPPPGVPPGGGGQSPVFLKIQPTPRYDQETPN